MVYWTLNVVYSMSSKAADSSLMYTPKCLLIWLPYLQTQPKVQDYEKVRKAIGDLMSSEEAEDYDDGKEATP